MPTTAAASAKKRPGPIQDPMTMSPYSRGRAITTAQSDESKKAVLIRRDGAPPDLEAWLDQIKRGFSSLYAHALGDAGYDG